MPMRSSTGAIVPVPGSWRSSSARGGVIGSDATKRERIAGYKVDCVDATGAGDCFAGALLARMSAGDDFWQALRYANAAAALTTTGYGAVAPLPRPEAVRRLLNRG